MKKSTAQLVDELGALKAKIADLTTEEQNLRIQLIARAGVKIGETQDFDGEMFRATVNRTEQERLDMKAVRAKLTAQFIRAHTNISEVVTVKVVARIRAERRKAA